MMEEATESQTSSRQAREGPVKGEAREGKAGEEGEGESHQAICIEDIKSLVLFFLFPSKDHCAQVGQREAPQSFLVTSTFKDLDGRGRMGSKETERFK